MKKKHKKKNTWGIIGCGRIGSKVAKKLLFQGENVVATYRGNKMEEVRVDSKGGHLKWVIYNLYQQEESQTRAFKKYIKGVDGVVITVPFSRSLINPWEYKKGISYLTQQIRQTSCQTVVFTSSTSIYYNGYGKKVSEGQAWDLSRNNERSKVLYECEQELIGLPSVNTLILRLGGILREPYRRNILNRKKQYVNLIEEEDIIHLISQYLLMTSPPSGIMNVVQDRHFFESPIRPGQEKDKVVTNKKLKQVLGYQPQKLMR